MKLSEAQQFASPEEALRHVSEAAWSDFTKADYTVEQWHAACLIHDHDGAPTSKSQCKLPVKTPEGALNRNGVHAAAAALAGARGGLKNVSAEEKKKAGNALKRYYAQLDEDPPESLSQSALSHHGVKGMKWGVRKEEETSGVSTARKNETTKRSMVETLSTGNATLRSPGETRTSTGKVQPSTPVKEPRLTPTQKKALIAAAVGTTAFVGFLAYKKYAGGSGLSVDPELADLVRHPISKSPLGGLGHGHPEFELRDPHLLEVNLSKGYADIRPAGGFANDYVTKRHGELISTLDEFRGKYPTLKNMNIEVVPMSHVPGMEGLVSSKCPAAVVGIKKGEARLMFNDVMDGLNPFEKSFVYDSQPGVFTDKFLGYHELGHMLAVGHGELPSAFDLTTKTYTSVFEQTRAMMKYKTTQNELHKNLFKKHGLTFKELSKLSKYGATEPAEALAELSGYFHTPKFRAKMDPELARKAEALFKDLGGVE